VDIDEQLPDIDGYEVADQPRRRPQRQRGTTPLRRPRSAPSFSPAPSQSANGSS
jgi:CheY-like chemotaxis protein